MCACVCVLWIINVNHYGAMLYTQSNKNKKKANRLVTRIHKISPLSPNWSLNLHNLQHLPLTKDWFPAVIQLGFVTWCWLLFINEARYLKNKTKRHPYSEPLTSNTVHQTRLPFAPLFPPITFIDLLLMMWSHCWTNQRKIRTDSCSKRQPNGDFCIVDHYCWSVPLLLL